MKELRTVREALGISQLQMARLLGVSRGHLGMAENSQRAIGFPAEVYLYQASRLLDTMGELPAEPEPEALPEMAGKEVQLLNVQIHRLEKKQKEILDTYNKARRLQAFVSRLLVEPQATVRKDLKTLCRIWQRTAEQDMITYGLDVQKETRMRLECLRMQRDFWLNGTGG